MAAALAYLALAGAYKIFGFGLLATRIVGIFWELVALEALLFTIRAITNRFSIAVPEDPWPAF